MVFICFYDNAFQLRENLGTNDTTLCFIMTVIPHSLARPNIILVNANLKALF